MDAKKYIEKNQERWLNTLKNWLRIPSVSSVDSHKDDVERAADFLVQDLKARGFERVEKHLTSANPVVFAEHCRAPGKPTLLIYGHYDVMPPDPVEQWTSPPFAPEVRNGMLYGRGSADDKGQIAVHLDAMETLIHSGEMPVNFKLIIEGGEEVGSPGLDAYLQAHKSDLACDAIVVSDTPMAGIEQPSLCLGLRGLCYMEIFVDGPSTDLHSGSFGGVVRNPANALAHIVASLQDLEGRVQIEGFYDNVRALDEADRQALLKAGPSDEELLTATGAPGLHGETGFAPVERLWARPTLDVNGIWSGFIAEGTKTVIPATAGVKVSMRLVADQNPDKIAELFEAHVRKISPEGVRVRCVRHHGGRPYLAPSDGPVIRAAREALRQVFDREPVLVREGGSIPIVITLAETLGADVVLMGIGYPGECSHAPDEHLPLVHLEKGRLAALELYQRVGQGQ